MDLGDELFCFLSFSSLQRRVREGEGSVLFGLLSASYFTHFIMSHVPLGGEQQRVDFCEKSKSHTAVGSMEDILGHPLQRVCLHESNCRGDHYKPEGYVSIHCHLRSHIFTREQYSAHLLPYSIYPEEPSGP